MTPSKRQGRAVGRLAGAGITKAARKLDESYERILTEARAGDGAKVREYREQAADFRADAAKDRATADEADAKGKQGKSKRHRRVADRCDRLADEADAKADAESQRLLAWAAERDAEAPQDDTP